MKCVSLQPGADLEGFRAALRRLIADQVRPEEIVWNSAPALFEEPPANGGEPSDKYRTYTLWIVPNSVYRRGIKVQVVTPSDAPVASTVLP